MKYVSIDLTEYSNLKEVFERNFGHDAQMYSYLRPSHLVGVEYDGDIVGAGGLFSNELHDKVPVMAIAIDENHRRKGLATLIHQKILASNPNIPLGIDGACFDFDAQAQGFMKHLNYRQYLECVTPLIDLKAGIQGIDQSADLEILTLEDSVKNESDKGLIVEFLAKRYSASHHWSPVALLANDPLWEKIALDKADMSLSAVAFEKGQIVGVSTATSKNEMLQIIWSYAKDGPLKLQLEILKRLFSYQFEIALSRNLTCAATECDSTEEAMALLPKDLSVIESESWLRFRFRPD